ncbi:hypothetical protein [Nocardia fluminea]|uniref:hypothetical protein n=1 Tax=Nocardia fluminea TaxID=134984 RepID=UPI00364EB749
MKQLVEIRKDLGGLDRERVVNAAIQRELGRLKDLNDARVQGRIQYAIVWVKQNPMTANSIASAFVVLNLALLITVFRADMSPVSKAILSVVFSVAPLLSIAASTYLRWTTEQKNRQQHERTAQERRDQIARLEASVEQTARALSHPRTNGRAVIVHRIGSRIRPRSQP